MPAPDKHSGETAAVRRALPGAHPATAPDLLGHSAEELRAWMAAAGEPGYRGAQLYHAIYAERRFDFAAMSNLPAALRERLAAKARIGIPQILRRYCSSDGSVRYLLGPQTAHFTTAHFSTAGFPTADFTKPPEEFTKIDPASIAAASGSPADIGSMAAIGAPPSGRSDPGTPAPARVEAVFMPSAGRQTICISTQAGCAVDCHFCLTARLGLIRNLTAGEMAGQVLALLEDHRESLAPRTNVVLMGQGEPLLNFDAVMAAVRLMLEPNGMGLAARHVTLSTSGIVPGIARLGREKVRPRLAVSLNASHDEQRDAIMPINRKYPLRDLLAACREYPLRPWERLTFEYVLLGGYNDAPEDARRVARLIDGLRAKVNLIPWNPGELPYRAPEAARVEQFRNVLVEKGVPAFIRYSRGGDISAACGQLALLETPA
jgi:23S rRNA (adenine2503-C2)-methyltransferase